MRQCHASHSSIIFMLIIEFEVNNLVLSDNSKIKKKKVRMIKIKRQKSCANIKVKELKCN